MFILEYQKNIYILQKYYVPDQEKKKLQSISLFARKKRKGMANFYYQYNLNTSPQFHGRNQTSLKQELLLKNISVCL